MKRETLELLDSCHFYRDMGLSILPCNGKQPSFSWKHLTQRHPTSDEIQRWVRQGMQNVGIICGQISGVVALDFDTREKLAILEKLPPSDMVTETPRGRHVYLRLQEGQEVRPRVHVGGMALDVRGACSYCIAPPSELPSGKYVRVGGWNLQKVPQFDPAWIQETNEVRKLSKPVTLTGDVVDRARRYISRIDAVSGKGGHSATYRTACKLADFGLGEDSMLALMEEWNEGHASPPWTRGELLHKVQDALKRKV